MIIRICNWTGFHNTWWWSSLWLRMRSKQPRWIVSQEGGGDTYCTIPPLVVDMRMMILASRMEKWSWQPGWRWKTSQGGAIGSNRTNLSSWGVAQTGFHFLIKRRTALFLNIKIFYTGPRWNWKVGFLLSASCHFSLFWSTLNCERFCTVCCWKLGKLNLLWKALLLSLCCRQWCFYAAHTHYYKWQQGALITKVGHAPPVTQILN